MSIESILVVLMYSAKPYLWLIALVVIIPIICYFIQLEAPLLSGLKAVLVSAVVGVVIALAAPYITHSKLEYVTTLTDWASLIGILVGASIYCWISLMLLFDERV